MTPELVTPTILLLSWAFAGFFLGSIPFGLIIARIMGLGDLSQIGSGNIGATNVLRTGSKLGALNKASQKAWDAAEREGEPETSLNITSVGQSSLSSMKRA